MRTLVILITLSFGSLSMFGQSKHADTILIKNAIDSNFLNLEIEGFAGTIKYRSIDNTGFYFGKCVTITFENITDSALTIKMPVGSILKCRDTTVQDMIVTKSFTLNLQPHFKEGYLIYAMCGEISNAPPRKGKFYDYVGISKPSVIKIAQFIDENNIQNNLGQYVMWAVRNNADSTKLINYGASYSDLQFIVDNLYELDITTILTQQIEPIKLKFDENPEEISEFEISNFSWMLITICGAIIFVLILIIIKKKKYNPAIETRPKLPKNF